MSYCLRLYQQKAVDDMLSELQHYTKPFVINLHQGGGKSWIIAEVAKQVGKCLVICMSKELVEQDAEKIRAVGADCTIYSASCGEKIISDITVATIGSIRKVPEYCQGFNLIIIDECFVAGTKVDGKNIEDIKVGDYVKSFNLKTGKQELKQVKRVIKKQSPDKLYRIKGTCGAIISTGNHQHYTQRGWVRADEIKEGDIIYGNQDVRTSSVHNVREDSLTTGNDERAAEVLLPNRENVLQHSLREGVISESIISKTKRPKPQKQDIRGESKNVSYKKGEGDTANLDNPSRTQGRKWQVFRTAKNLVRKTWKRVDDGVADTDWTHKRRKWVSNLLQSGCGQPVLSDSDRTGRPVAQWALGKSSGREEDNSLREFRVDSVEILERKDYGGLGLSDNGDYVYCISVEDNHNFFANGILTHNCDQVPCDDKDSMFSKFFKVVRKPVVGLTGTAFRTDYSYSRQKNGDVIQITHVKSLDNFKFWGKTINEATYQDLRAMNYLSPIQYSVAKADRSMLRTNSTGLDYTEDSLADYGLANRTRVAECINGALNVWKCKRVLVAVPNIEEAEAIGEMCGAGVVHSKMAKKERTKIVNDFKSGKIKAVVQVLTLNVGFDLPALDCVIFARPSKSLRIWCQFVGRGIRIDPDDDSKVCRCIDMGGMLELYGRIEDVKVKGGKVYGTYGSISDKALNRVNITEMQRRFH